MIVLLLLVGCTSSKSEASSKTESEPVTITIAFEEPIEVYVPPKPTGRYQSIQLSEDERGLIAMVVYREARGESDEGQKAIVEIILNRYLSAYGGSTTIYDVIYAERQFSCAHMLTTKPITELGRLSNAFDMVDEVLKETTYEVKSYYMYFNTEKPKTSDYIKIGNHYFY